MKTMDGKVITMYKDNLSTLFGEEVDVTAQTTNASMIIFLAGKLPFTFHAILKPDGKIVTMSVKRPSSDN